MTAPHNGRPTRPQLAYNNVKDPARTPTGAGGANPDDPTPRNPTWLYSPLKVAGWEWLHPFGAVGGIYFLVGQGIINMLGMPNFWHLPLGISDWRLPIPLALVYIPLLVICGLLLTYGERFHGAAKAYFAGAGLVAGVWTAYATAAGVYDPWTIGAAAVALLVFTAGYPGMRDAQRLAEEEAEQRRRYFAALRAAQQPQASTAAPTTSNEEKDRWEYTFNVAKATGLEFVERRAGRAGPVIHARLPMTGLSWRTLNSDDVRENLERALEQAAGSIRMERVKGRDGRFTARDVLIYLDVVDVLSEILNMDDDTHPISILEAFKIGKYADGEWIYLTLEEVHVLIVGMTGGGKSYLLHVIMRQLTRCYDAVVLGIDPKGGNTFRPWVNPWVKGLVDRPAVEWLAIDPWGAHQMLLAVLATVIDRNERMVNGFTPSRENPAYILITDEISEISGEYASPIYAGQYGAPEDQPTGPMLAALLVRIVTLARSAGVWSITASQRGTADYLGNAAMKKQIKVRIVLGVADEDEARYAGIDKINREMVAQLEQEGVGLVTLFGKKNRNMLGRFFFLGAKTILAAVIEQIMIAHMGNPGDYPGKPPGPAIPDRRNQALWAKYGYNERWSNPAMQHWLYNTDDNDDGGTPITRPPRPNTPTSPGGVATQAAPAAPPASEWFSDLAKYTDAAQAAQDNEGAPAGADTTAQDEAFAAVVGPLVEDPDWQAALAQVFTDGADPDDADEGAPAGEGKVSTAERRRMFLEILEEAGPTGITPGELADALIEQGLITRKGRSAYRRLVLWGVEEGHVFQATEGTGRIYLRRLMPGGPGR